VRQVLELLRVCDHNGFPVVSRDHGKYSGLILRSQLITLLRVRAFFDGSEVRNTFYQLATQADFLADYPRYPSIDSVHVRDEDLDLYIGMLAGVSSGATCVCVCALSLRVVAPIECFTSD
jgi:hypothetical protein